jgi:hypothetical protein
MSNKRGFVPQKRPQRESPSPMLTDLVYISFSIDWEDMVIADYFHWPVTQNDLGSMRDFAANFLADYLGDRVHLYSSSAIESKTNHILIY